MRKISDGLPRRMTETETAHRARKEGLKLIAASFNSQDIAKQINDPSLKIFFGVAASGWKNTRQMAFMANGFLTIRLATEEGDHEKDSFPWDRCKV
jgi:hypothetical protein